MNLATMRTRFAEHVSDLSSDLSDSDIDAYLNRAYRYVIPSDVGGEFSEGTWELTTEIGTDVYPYASHVIAPNGESAWINSYVNGSGSTIADQLQFLGTETNRTVFEYADRYDAPSTGRPNACLFYARQVFLTPVPDTAYIVKIPVRMGPSSDLPDAGIVNDNHALAAVTSAAIEFLVESEDADGVMREEALYQRYKQRLNVAAQARPNARRWKRSF